MTNKTNYAHLFRKMERWKAISPSEESEPCVFKNEHEDDPLIFFHATPSRNFESIVQSGFLSASTLNKGELASVSYAKRSSLCLVHIGNPVTEDYTIFAVKFESLEQQAIRVNGIDINVYSEIQPDIVLGYCEIPRGFHYS